jgi:hypothetical protein
MAFDPAGISRAGSRKKSFFVFSVPLWFPPVSVVAFITCVIYERIMIWVMGLRARL